MDQLRLQLGRKLVRKCFLLMRQQIEKLVESPWFWGTLLVALMIQSLPLMLCMPLTADAVLYDLQAKTAFQGGVLYRDIVEPNLPGIVWLHMLIRSLFGWSTTALRLVDLGIVAGIVLLLVFWHRSGRAKAGKQTCNESIFLALMLFWFYFGTSEWCHCQRDIWMLLPALAALYLRRNQITRLSSPDCSKRNIFQWGILEGVIWAVGFWLKPFIAIPAIVVLILGLIVIGKEKSFRLKKTRSLILFDLLAVLAGGLLIGLLGIGWLVQSGTWPHFLEMMLEWNPTYFEVGSDRWTWDRLVREQLRFMPFSLFHLLAIPLSLFQIAKMLSPAHTIKQKELSRLLLCGLYSGWLIQSFTMQHLFDYVHVPEVFLAITIVIRYARIPLESVAAPSAIKGTNSSANNVSIVAAFVLMMLALITNPATSWKRTSYWKTCLIRGSTPEVKNAVQHFALPNWVELQPALDFLRERNLRDQELTVHNVHLVHAYRELGLKPSTRFVYLDVLTRIFHREHAEEIVNELDRSGHRYVLSGLIENGMLPQNVQSEGSRLSFTLPEKFPREHLSEFPYHFPVVFRSGQYVVHRVDKSSAPLNPAFMPLSYSSYDHYSGSK